MSSGSFKNNVTSKLCNYKLYIFTMYIYKHKLVLSNLQELVCHKSQPTNQLEKSLEESGKEIQGTGNEELRLPRSKYYWDRQEYWEVSWRTKETCCLSDFSEGHQLRLVRTIVKR